MSETTTLRELVAIDSPSGYTHRACAYAHDLLTRYGWSPEYTLKGAVRCSLGDPGQAPKLAIAAHVDTLGGIVQEVSSDGSLRISMIGSYAPQAFEGCYVRVHTLNDQIFTGTLLIDDPAVHASRNVHNMKRKLSNMHVRLDEEVTKADETRKLGIRVGDFVCFEPHYTELDSGYIKSRFMDNKSGCYILFEVARRLKEAEKKVPVELFFSNYEEVGHGGATGYSPSVESLLVVDMGVVGEHVSGKETAVSICAKDSSGPYDFEFRKKLINLSEQEGIPYEVSIYPFYGSDGSAALKAGQNVKVGLIGPGVSASHGVERTHKKGLEATIQLCLAFIETIDSPN